MYTKEVMRHFMHPKNIGSMKNPDGKATEGSMACGDVINIYIKVNPKTKRISDIRFESYGCAANIATTSVMTEMARGKTIERAKDIKFDDIVKKLGGLPANKMHCSVLSVKGLRKAIEDYEKRH